MIPEITPRPPAKYVPFVEPSLRTPFTHCLHGGLPPLANDHLRSVSFEFGILLDAANKCSLREFVFVSHLLFLNMFLFNMELSPTL